MKTGAVELGHGAVWALVVMLALAGVGCGSGQSRPPSSGDPEADRRAEQRVGAEDDRGNNDARTLYKRIGGNETISAIVEDMTARVIADPRVNFERQDVRKNLIGV